MMTINFAALEDMIRINERAPEIEMSGWINKCGTHGCLCGNYALVRREFLCGHSGIASINLQEHLGITDGEFMWLFTSNPLRQDCNAPPYVFSRRSVPAAALSGPDALARLKKFVAYKKEKASVSLERGRQISGLMTCHKLSQALSA